RHILEISSGLEASMFAAHGALAMARAGRLERRLRTILDSGSNRGRASGRLVVLVMTIGAAVVIPLSALRAENAATAAGPPGSTRGCPPFIRPPCPQATKRQLGPPPARRGPSRSMACASASTPGEAAPRVWECRSN